MSAALSETKPMIVAGLMSGTSADGVDVALVRIRRRDSDLNVDLKLLAHCSFPFSPSLRRAVLGSMNAKEISTAELARLNWRLGIAYAEAVRETLAITHGEARSDWLPWTDDLSPRQGCAICWARFCVHVADWGDGDVGARSGRARGLKLQTCRYGGWRTGSATGAALGLRSVS